MLNNTARIRYIAILVLIVAAFSMLFLLSYKYDNKYTEESPQPQDGVLTLTSQDLSEYPIVHLTGGWEYYPGYLLTPADPKPDPQIIYIGEYQGFERSNANGDPHGNASYSLKLNLPAEANIYMLELPEIYSAYTLYINGQQKIQMGDTNPQSYRAETGNTSIALDADTDNHEFEILIAASDYDYIYSGMTYPPAFGTQKAITKLLDTRLAFRTFLCASALCVGILYLLLGFASRQRKLPVLFALLCLTFTVTIAYPVVKTLFHGGLIWYSFENFCYVLMMGIVLLLHFTLSHSDNSLWKKACFAALILCAIIGILSLVLPFLWKDSLTVMLLYSNLLDGFKWLCAIYITTTAVISVKNSNSYSILLLSGILIYDCSLIFDRLLPLFEPIRLGWFTEIGGFALVVCIGIAMAREVDAQYKNNFVMAVRIEKYAQLIQMQKIQYPILLQQAETARTEHHDLRHHLNVMKEMLASGNIDRLTDYLYEYESRTGKRNLTIYTPHFVVDIILHYFADEARKRNIDFDAKADIPEHTNINDSDICAILSNLLENALEACTLMADGKWIRVFIKKERARLGIVVENSFDGVLIKDETGSTLSRKQFNRKGLGLSSVEFIAENCGGTANFNVDREKSIFKSWVLLPIEDNDKESGSIANSHM